MTAEKLLSHYELLEKLGEGGMGALYRARDTRLNRTVAIKLLREGGYADPDRARRLVQEARAACQLNDPHIVTIYEVDDSPGREFIAMELVDGESLSARLSRGPLPMAEVLRIAVEAAEGLAAAHAVATRSCPCARRARIAPAAGMLAPSTAANRASPYCTPGQPPPASKAA